MSLGADAPDRLQALVDDGDALAHVDDAGTWLLVLGRDTAPSPAVEAVLRGLGAWLRVERSRWTTAQVREALDHLGRPGWHAGTATGWAFFYDPRQDAVEVTSDAAAGPVAELVGRFGDLVVHRAEGPTVPR